MLQKQPESIAKTPNVETKNAETILLWLVAAAVFMETLDSTVVNTALPSMAHSLNVSPLQMYSIIIAYSLTLAVLIPATGWVADRFGTRRVFLSAIGIFSLGSLCCALSQNLSELVMARILQGIGGSMMLPVGRLSVLHAFPKEKYVRAISFVAIPGLVGPLIGPTLGGTLAELASWHWIFLINLPIGLIGAIATYKYMPDYRMPDLKHFDSAGFFMLAFCMLAMSLGLDGLSELGFEHATVLLLLIISLACFSAYWLHARRTPEALFSLELFKVPSFTVGLIGNMFARIGSGAMPFLVPLFLQLSLGYSPLHAGFMMLPVALASIAAKSLALPLLQRFGYRTFLVGNTVLVGVAIVAVGFVSAHEPLFLLIVQLGFFGLVNSLQFTAMNTVTLKDVEMEQASSSNSLYSMVQMLSMSFGVAAAGAFIATFNEHFTQLSGTPNVLKAFQATFYCMGVITCTSAVIFWQLNSEVHNSKQPA